MIRTPPTIISKRPVFCRQLIGECLTTHNDLNAEDIKFALQFNCDIFSDQPNCNTVPGCGWQTGSCEGDAELCNSSLRDSAEKCELDPFCQWFKVHIDEDDDGFSPQDNC